MAAFSFFTNVATRKDQLSAQQKQQRQREQKQTPPPTLTYYTLPGWLVYIGSVRGTMRWRRWRRRKSSAVRSYLCFFWRCGGVPQGRWKRRSRHGADPTCVQVSGDVPRLRCRGSDVVFTAASTCGRPGDKSGKIRTSLPVVKYNENIPLGTHTTMCLK